jgi:tetratricopeptide (TPR) repeat protein
MHGTIAAHVAREAFVDAYSMSSKAIEVHPLHQPLALQHIRLLMRLGRNAQALEFLGNLSAKLRTGAVVLPHVQLLLAAGLTRDAAEVLRQVPEPERSRLPFQLATIALCRHQKGPDAAISLANDYCAKFPDRQHLWQEGLNLREAVLSPEDRLDWLGMNCPFRDARPMKLARVRALARSGRWDGAEAELSALLAEEGPSPQLLAMQIGLKRQLDLHGEALRLCDEALIHFPLHPGLLKHRLDLLVATGRRHDALPLCKDIAERMPENANMLLNLAQSCIYMGEDDKAEDLLHAADDLGAPPARLAIVAASLCSMRMDSRSALQILREARDSMPDQIAIQRRLAEIEFNQGLLREPSDWLIARVSASPEDQDSRLVLARQYLDLAQHDLAQDLVELGVPTGPLAQKRSASLLADIALERGRPDEAIRRLEPIVARFPKWIEGQERLTRAELLTGQLDVAWTRHIEVTRLRAITDAKGDKSNKALHSINGQIMNEFRLLSTEDDLNFSAPAADANEAIHHYRARLSEAPDSTPCALLLMSALRRNGRLVSPTVALDANTIPRNLFQFWDDPEPTEQVRGLTRRNADLNPDFTYSLFNQQTARAYLAEKGETRALRAFRLATHPAGKADILRLALLWHEGGVYMDADDLCLLPLSEALPLNRRFVGYQEYFMSVGNNFLAVRPGEPAIRSALDDAATAFDGPQGESLWLSTGPGAMTRAVARHLVTTEGELAEGVQLLTAGQLRGFVVSHMPLSYKKSDRHWTARFKRSA